VTGSAIVSDGCGFVLIGMAQFKIDSVSGTVIGAGSPWVSSF
jgi:hypothetical protein